VELLVAMVPHTDNVSPYVLDAFDVDSAAIDVGGMLPMYTNVYNL